MFLLRPSVTVSFNENCFAFSLKETSNRLPWKLLTLLCNMTKLFIEKKFDREKRLKWEKLNEIIFVFTDYYAKKHAVKICISKY